MRRLVVPRTASSVSLRQPSRWASIVRWFSVSGGGRAGRCVQSCCGVSVHYCGQEICDELMKRRDAGAWADGRMKLSFWTCRSKNSWVLYSYREVSETFHFCLHWSARYKTLICFVHLFGKFCFENSVILGYDPAFWDGYLLVFWRFVVPSFPG